jgi:hypothetical protein
VCSATAQPTSPRPSQRRRRYPSDTTDTEWTLLEALPPPPASTQAWGAGPGGGAQPGLAATAAPSATTSAFLITTGPW